MAYFADLTPHIFPFADADTLNVGWLESGHEFERGPVNEKFAYRLNCLAESPVNLMRDLHYCDLCILPQELIEASQSILFGWDANWSGTGEVRVKDKNGTCFVAPALIWHYVTEHQYKPPQQFVDAVIWATDNPESQPNWDLF